MLKMKLTLKTRCCTNTASASTARGTGATFFTGARVVCWAGGRTEGDVRPPFTVGLLDSKTKKKMLKHLLKSINHYFHYNCQICIVLIKIISLSASDNSSICNWPQESFMISAQFCVHKSRQRNSA